MKDFFIPALNLLRIPTLRGARFAIQVAWQLHIRVFSGTSKATLKNVHFRLYICILHSAEVLGMGHVERVRASVTPS